MMFQEWCRRFDKNEYRNHFVKWGTSIKAAQRCISICMILVSLSFRKKSLTVAIKGQPLATYYLLLIWHTDSPIPDECNRHVNEDMSLQGSQGHIALSHWVLVHNFAAKCLSVRLVGCGLQKSNQKLAPQKSKSFYVGNWWESQFFCKFIQDFQLTKAPSY